MPELPDVEVLKRHLDTNALGRPIARTAVADARILDGISAQRLATLLKRRRFQSSRRHGKHLFVRLDEGGWLTLHFGMSGGLELFDAGGDEPRFTRVRFDFEDGSHLAYTARRMLGRVGLAEDADEFIRNKALGPDALDERLNPDRVADALGKGRRGIKAALMDQSVMAGIGNIYSDEILFQARIHPAVPVAALGRERLRQLSTEIRNVLETAIRHGAGSERFIDRLPAGYLLPRREKGGACPRCGSRIQTIKMSGRTAYYCPKCQRREPSEHGKHAR